MSPLDHLEVFYGDCSPASAQVYARVPGLSPDDGWTISGTVRGPECAIARTLPATIRMTDAGPGEGLLARTVVPDPCGWSPELPAIYRVTVELHQHGDDVASAQRSLGLRMLGPRGRSLYLEGRRWVMRGMCRNEVEPADLAAWREAVAVMSVADPDDALCEAASSQGVLLAVRLTRDTDACISELKRLSCFPAVAVAIIERPNVEGEKLRVEGEKLRVEGEKLRRAAPNILLAAYVSVDAEPIVPPWAQAVVCEVADPSGFASRLAQAMCPVIAYRPLGRVLPLSEARGACDHLQRDLAPFGDFAGYLA
jgi:hypothetical protein